MTKKQAKTLRDILSAMFPDRHQEDLRNLSTVITDARGKVVPCSPGRIESVAAGLADCAELTRCKGGQEKDPVRATRLHRAFTEGNERFSAMAEEARGLLHRFGQSVEAIQAQPGARKLLAMFQADEVDARKAEVTGALSLAAETLEGFARACVRAADLKRPQRGAPPKQPETHLAMDIVATWTKLNAVAPFPLPQTNPKGNPVSSMTTGQLMGALCQTLGQMAGMDTCANTTRWSKRLKKALTSL